MPFYGIGTRGEKNGWYAMTDKVGLSVCLPTHEHSLRADEIGMWLYGRLGVDLMVIMNM